MDTSKLKPGDPITPCTEAPTLRVRDQAQKVDLDDLAGSEGYSSRGHIKHFLPDREVNLAKLNKALADVFGEPALRLTELSMRIDEEYWKQICGDPWSANVYTYRFLSPDARLSEIEDLKTSVEKLKVEVNKLKGGE
ncbi:hypothetical protein [Cupriavidus sp. DF5525]|uniref:hypothetical protein n=1 Tax=Cupriavidus sp. DF5525 TaxID=3160989 RepID=UPI0032DEC0D8